jgi:hypothetical protein
MLPTLLEELATMDDKGTLDDFTGNPWHPFLRVLRRRAAIFPPERLSRSIDIPGNVTATTWGDLFRNDPVTGRLVPARDLTEVEVHALADWLGLEDEERASFLELGAAFIAQRDSLRELRNDPGLVEDDESEPRAKVPPRPARPILPEVAIVDEPELAAESPLDEETIPGMETAASASDCIQLLCRHRQTDLEWLARAVAQRIGSSDSRSILLQFRGTLTVVSDKVLDAALAILDAPPLAAAQARAFKSG